MASPFKFFRKYSGGMMVIMVILSMLLFTLTDLFTDPGANLWLLGILVGGTVFGIAGIGQGKWLQWGIGGAVLGAALGFILPGFVGNDGLSTSLGVIDEEEIYDLQARRMVANQFIIQITEASFGEGAGRFASLFGFGHRSEREDVIFGKLLRAEADRIGITVDAAMVGEYLKRIMNEKLTREDYISSRNNLSYQRSQLDDDTLTSILTDEIKARMAYQILRPRTTSLPPAPEVYWSYYRRLNVRQQLDLAALDVDGFVGDVREPTDAEVSQLFAQYNRKFLNQDEPGSPGFRLPFRARIAYLEVDSKSVTEEVDTVTDAEIQSYYDENKETPLIRRPVIPDFDDEPKPAEKKPEAADPEMPSDKAAPAVPEKPAEDAKPMPPETEKPADATKPTEPADSKPAEAPKAAAEPATEKPGEESTPKSDEPAPATSENPAQTGSDDPETESSSEEGCGPFDESSAAEEAEETAAAPEPVATETAADEKAADVKPADEKAADVKPVDDKPADDKPPMLTIPPAPDTPEISPKKKATELEYEYRELDDELKAEIRDEIIRERVREAIDERMQKAVAQMETLARTRSKERFAIIEKDPSRYEGGEQQQEALKQLREQMQPSHEKLNAQLKEYAAANGLAYVDTPLVTYAELVEEEDYPIGSATEPNDDPTLAAQSASVATTLFQSFSADEQTNDAQLYLVRRAQRGAEGLDGGEYHYAWWAIDFSPSHVPTLDEPGVRDSVVLTWKRLQARELVVKRGEELAGKIKEGLAADGDQKRDMAAVLKDETTTGSEDGSALAVRRTLPFSWLRTSMASPMDFQPRQASQSPIQFEDTIGGQLRKVGDEFMKSVFEDMVDEDVSVVPNFDRSKYYIVHVTNRFPTPEVGEDGLRDRFAEEGKLAAFVRSPMIGVMEQQLAGPTNIEWERNIWLRYDINPDEEPEE